MTTSEAASGSTISSVEIRTSPAKVATDRYTSSDWADRERERLWPTTWQLAATVDHLASPGDWKVYDCGPLSVLIVHGDDGVLRAFQNACRHRGSALCEGTGSDAEHIRCPYHRWTWNLRGELREVPSRRGFGALPNDDLPLLPARVDTWAGLVFVNLDLKADPLDGWLEGVPADAEGLGLEDHRCRFTVTIPLPCNWKVGIEAFSETYHVQGIHRELLPTVDDVNSPQMLWDRHGKLTQPYGLPSPRLRDVSPAETYRAFVETMGTRAGFWLDPDHAPPAPEVGDNRTIRDEIGHLVRHHHEGRGLNLDGFSDADLMDLHQYNLFPNCTIVGFPDLLQIVTVRPGATPDESFLDGYFFERMPTGTLPGPQPEHVVMSPDEADFGMVLNQDIDLLTRVQRGLHQPGLTHLALSGEECRIINLHRQLDELMAD